MCTSRTEQADTVSDDKGHLYHNRSACAMERVGGDQTGEENEKVMDETADDETGFRNGQKRLVTMI